MERQLLTNPQKTYTEFRCSNCEWTTTFGEIIRTGGVPTDVVRKFGLHACSSHKKATPATGKA
jgi:hypothetical protein